jgi:hypothetical protein
MNFKETINDFGEYLNTRKELSESKKMIKGKGLVTLMVYPTPDDLNGTKVIPSSYGEDNMDAIRRNLRDNDRVVVSKIMVSEDGPIRKSMTVKNRDTLIDNFLIEKRVTVNGQ